MEVDASSDENEDDEEEASDAGDCVDDAAERLEKKKKLKEAFNAEYPFIMITSLLPRIICMLPVSFSGNGRLSRAYLRDFKCFISPFYPHIYCSILNPCRPSLFLQNLTFKFKR